jgi:hypothetical protein
MVAGSSSTRIGFDPDDFCFVSVRDYAPDRAGATAHIQHARSGWHQILCHPIARTMARKMFGVFLKEKPLPATTGTGTPRRGRPQWPPVLGWYHRACEALNYGKQ